MGGDLLVSIVAHPGALCVFSGQPNMGVIC